MAPRDDIGGGVVIRRSDRLAEMLRRDEHLIETLIAESPAFRGLRNPLMRKTMGRLATVEQAARVAGVDPHLLTERLNRALTRSLVPTNPAATARNTDTHSIRRSDMPTAQSDLPPALASLPPERITDLDVREDLRSGQEPFSRIMTARRELPRGGVLRLRAIFEPVPLYSVMAKQGFDHWTEKLSSDDWRVWFFAPTNRDDAATHPTHAEATPPQRSSPTTASTPGAPSAEEEGVIVLDVRGMEPPEPMVRTLAALEELPPGNVLLQINERIPKFLLPKLHDLGFTYEIRKQGDTLVRVFIRRRDQA